MQKTFLMSAKNIKFPAKNIFGFLQKTFENMQKTFLKLCKKPFFCKKHFWTLQKTFSCKKQYTKEYKLKKEINEMSIYNVLCILICANDADLLKDKNIK